MRRFTRFACSMTVSLALFALIPTAGQAAPLAVPIDQLPTLDQATAGDTVWKLGNGTGPRRCRCRAHPKDPAEQCGVIDHRPRRPLR